MAKKIIPFLVSLFIIAVSSIGATDLYEYPTEADELNGNQHYEQCVTRFAKTFYAHILEAFEVSPYGSFGGFHDYLKAGFNCEVNYRVSLDEARALEVTLLDYLAKALHADQELFPYLERLGLTPETVGVNIYFEPRCDSGFRGGFRDGTIEHVSFIRNRESPNDWKLGYSTTDAFTNWTHHKSYKEVPFSTYRCETADEVRSRLADPNDSPFCLQGSAFLSEVDRLFTWLKMQLSNWKGLEFSSFGWMQLDQKSPEISEIRAQCTVNRYVDREQARTLLLKAAEEILKALNSDTRIKPYLAESPFPVSRLKIALLFRQNRVFVGPRADYEGGSIESVDLIDGLLTYYSYLPITPEEDRKERTVYAQESYEEARRQMDLPTNVDTRFQRVWRDVQYFFRSLCEQLIGIIFGLFVIFSALLFPLHA